LFAERDFFRSSTSLRSPGSLSSFLWTLLIMLHLITSRVWSTWVPKWLQGRYPSWFYPGELIGVCEALPYW
jgi:hypothetical protein